MVTKVLNLNQDDFDKALDLCLGKWQIGLLLGTEDWDVLSWSSKHFQTAGKWRSKYLKSKENLMFRWEKGGVKYFWLPLDQGKTILCLGESGPLNQRNAYLMQANGLTLRQFDINKTCKKYKWDYTTTLKHLLAMWKLEGSLSDPHPEFFDTWKRRKKYVKRYPKPKVAKAVHSDIDLIF